MKLFCLPFAGGNLHAYNDFRKFLPVNIEMVTLELPGRGERIREVLLDDIDKAADDVFQRIKPQLRSPYIIYGHSMGSVLGYLLTHKIKDEKLPLPAHLFFSGGRAPTFLPGKKKSHLPHEEFWQVIKNYGGLKEEIFQHVELLELFEPIFRADFRAIEGYRHRNKGILNIPITIFDGTEDDIGNEALKAWQKETVYPVKFYEFSGKHFFIFEHSKSIIDIMIKES